MSLFSPNHEDLSRTSPSKRTSLMAQYWTLQYMNMSAWREWILLKGIACIPKCGGWSTEAMDQRITFWNPKQAFKRYWSLFCYNSLVCYFVSYIRIATWSLVYFFSKILTLTQSLQLNYTSYWFKEDFELAECLSKGNSKPSVLCLMDLSPIEFQN